MRKASKGVATTLPLISLKDHGFSDFDDALAVAAERVSVNRKHRPLDRARAAIALSNGVASAKAWAILGGKQSLPV
jgi:hypothetical protein